MRVCLGVLLVHGAGEHGQGNTLRNFGVPIVTWLDGWLVAASMKGGVEVGATRLVGSRAEGGDPTHGRLRLTFGGLDHEWLIAESRWDASFAPPSFSDVARWAVTVVPWTVWTHIVSPVLARYQTLLADPFVGLRFAWDLIVSIAFALVGMLVLQALAIVLLALSVIPIPAVRAAIGRAQRWASASAGDLYLVFADPFSRAALSSTVQRDIDWLTTNGAESIVVIAHSQGGYVAYRALSDPWARPVDHLITFGSGLIRLIEVEVAEKSGALRFAAAALVLGILFAAAFIAAISGLPSMEAFRLPSMLAIVLGALTWISASIARDRGRGRTPPITRPVTVKRWTDYLAPADPVLRGSREGRLVDVCL